MLSKNDINESEMSFLKKLFATILAFILVLSPLTLGVSAATINGSELRDVVASYVGSQTEEIVSVDLSWGSFEFVYNAENLGTWDPETHQYYGGTKAKWTYEDGANVLTITNHSNVAVTATLTYLSNDVAITGSFNTGTVDIPAATADNVPCAAVKLTLSGQLDPTNKNYSLQENNKYLIGSVCVDIK